MIHYHGAPISGNKTESARFFTGRHALVSFFNPGSLPAVSEYCQSFCLDNGAFSHWSAGNGDIDFNKYVDWVGSVEGHPALDFALIPDKIDGSEDENRLLIERWVNSNIRTEGVPVYHLHESLDYLNYLVSEFRTVAIGSSGQWSTPNTRKWWSRICDVMSIACDKNGVSRCRLHGLRMLDPDVFTRLPLSSADSTNAGVNAGSLSRFGSYVPPTAHQRAAVIAERIEMYSSSPIWISDSQLSLDFNVHRGSK